VTPAALLAAALLVAPPGPDKPAPSASPPAAGPRLVVEPAAFDFGAALPGKSLTKEFSLRNFGSALLVIEKLSSSCACTAYLLSEKDRRLAPGRRAPLRVTLKTPATPGLVAETVRIASNDPHGDTTIQVEATVTTK
jgi:hypothetical protein